MKKESKHSLAANLPKVESIDTLAPKYKKEKKPRKNARVEDGGTR